MLNVVLYNIRIVDVKTWVMHPPCIMNLFDRLNVVQYPRPDFTRNMSHL